MSQAAYDHLYVIIEQMVQVPYQTSPPPLHKPFADAESVSRGFLLQASEHRHEQDKEGWETTITSEPNRILKAIERRLREQYEARQAAEKERLLQQHKVGWIV